MALKSDSRVGRPKGEDVENTARRRQQLIDAMVTSIVENGLAATTLATVAKESGLSPGMAVFYFKNKESLLVEAFRFRLEEYKNAWVDALAAAGPDPVDRLLALVFASFDRDLVTPKNLALWHSFWPEASRNRAIVDLSDQYDAERQAVLASICEDARPFMAGSLWTPKLVCQALESITDGNHSLLHYSPDFMSVEDARQLAATILATVYPSRVQDIIEKAEEPDSDYLERRRHAP